MIAGDEHLSISRVFEAPRALVYRAFTDPRDFCAWWGPTGNQLPGDDLDFDVRSGGHQRWTEVNPVVPDLRVRVSYDLDEVVENQLIDGVMRVEGQLPGNHEPFSTRLRVRFHDESPGRTRIEIHQWVPDSLDAPVRQGWDEGLSKLITLLNRTYGAPKDRSQP